MINWLGGITAAVMVAATTAFFSWVGISIVSMDKKLDISIALQSNVTSVHNQEMVKLDARVARLEYFGTKGNR